VATTYNLTTNISVATSTPNTVVLNFIYHLSTAIAATTSTSTPTITGPTQILGQSGKLMGGQSNLIGELLLVTLPGNAGKLLGSQGAPITTTFFTVVVEGASGRLMGGQATLVVTPITLPVIVPGWSGRLIGATSGLVALTPKVVILPGASGRLLGALAWVVTQADIECWVLTGNTFNPSAYTGWPFNSFALKNGRYYAAGPLGLYLLEGENQAGNKIYSGARIGRVNFNTERQKRIRSMRLGATGPDVQVRVESEEKEAFFRPKDDIVTVSSEIQGREFVIDLQGFEELSFIEITPLILVTR
jgi:hypothetical protein